MVDFQPRAERYAGEQGASERALRPNGAVWPLCHGTLTRLRDVNVETCRGIVAFSFWLDAPPLGVSASRPETPTHTHTDTRKAFFIIFSLLPQL